MKMQSEDQVVGLLQLHKEGTNSTFFTECCRVAICDDECYCRRCGKKVIGWDAKNEHERKMVRWRHAYKG